MNFTTKLSGHDVTTTGPRSEDDFEMEGAFSVEWEYAVEMREWGVKDICVYATRVIGVVYKDDESIFEKDRQEIDTNDKGWVIDTDTSVLEYGNSICPQDVHVDLKNKIISINF